jgi:kinetochore protein Spc7/SPC105
MSDLKLCLSFNVNKPQTKATSILCPPIRHSSHRKTIIFQMQDTPNKNSKRLSLPPVSGVGNPNRISLSLVPNRRHTLVPSRSILKSIGEENNTISIPGDLVKARRRVSFAPEVTLHKINFSRANEEGNRSKRRSSLTGKNNDNKAQQHNSHPKTKLSTSQYIGKVYGDDNKGVEEPNNENEKDVEKEDVHTLHSTNNSNIDRVNHFIIDEDTQTMEMSVELTQQILKQQEEIKNQRCEASIEVHSDHNAHSLRDLFEEVEGDLNSGNGEDESVSVEMELTETINKSLANDLDQTDDMTMELTQPSPSSNVIIPQDSHIESEKENHVPFRKLDSKSNSFPPKETQQVDTESMQQELPTSNINVQFPTVDTILEEDTQTMELTQPITENLMGDMSLANGASEMRENAEIPKVLNAADPLFDSDEEAMELTETIPRLDNHRASNSHATEDSASPMNKATHHAVVSEYRIDEQNKGDGNEPAEVVPVKELTISIEEQISPGLDIERQADERDQSMISEDSHGAERDQSTDMETSLIGTEMIPLAEVTADFTENQEEYDSDDSFTDDNHVSVSLDVFLNDVNVQFFDNIGPSEMEVARTLQFSPSAKTSPSSSSSTLAISPTASILSSSSSSTQQKSSLIDYIDACTNIPYYHYVVHLINQYQTSIQSISTMVNTFSNDVLESNPTAIREFYQQSEDIKAELTTNYQAIAIFTRKQAKCQNMRFVSGLLEQLLTSFQRANELLEGDLSKALDWRRGVLIERQKMIEKKVELDQLISKLNTLRDNWNSINIERMKMFNEQLKVQKQAKSVFNSSIDDCVSNSNVLEGSVAEKMARKEELIQEVEQLRQQVSKLTVPSQDDLHSLTRELNNLEAEKNVKLISSDPITLSISKLHVKFLRNAQNDYTATMAVPDPEAFRPFSSLVSEFSRSHTRSMKHEEIVGYVKQLSHSWRKFRELWRELLLIHFIHSGSIEAETFTMKFSFSKPLGATNCQKLSIEGKTEHLLNSQHNIKVRIQVDDLNKPSVDEDSIVLESLKNVLGDEFGFVQRLCI